jgi:hypothetical protein
MLTRITTSLVAASLVAALALGSASVVLAKPATPPGTPAYSGLPNNGFGCDPDYGPNGYDPCADARR